MIPILSSVATEMLNMKSSGKINKKRALLSLADLLRRNQHNDIAILIFSKFSKICGLNIYDAANARWVRDWSLEHGVVQNAVYWDVMVS